MPERDDHEAPAATPTADAGATGATESGTDVAKKDKEPFTFTDPGCRTEIRIGTLMILVAVFLWLWLGPRACSLLFLAALPLLLIGAPWQAMEARTEGRPGYPLKLGLVLTVGALLMWPDLQYREHLDGPVHVQPLGWMLLSSGLWLLAWWPLARTGRAGRPDPAPEAAGAAA